MTEPLPQDMRDLLIRLDQRVADGFDGVRQKLDAMDKRADNIENRVASVEREIADRPHLIAQHQNLLVRVDDLEDSRTKQAAALDGATKVGKFLWTSMGAVALVLGYIGYKVEVAPDPAVMTHKSVETLTVPQH